MTATAQDSQKHSNPMHPDLGNPHLQRWVRLPLGTQCEQFSGLRRTALMSLCKRAGGEIKTVNLRESGKKRGNRLIWLPSLMAHLHKLADAQIPGGADCPDPPDPEEY
jgi:hypothetical protein